MMKSHVKCHPFITNLGSKESYFNFDKIVARTTSIYESKIMHSKGIKNQEKGKTFWWPSYRPATWQYMVGLLQDSPEDCLCSE